MIFNYIITITLTMFSACASAEQPDYYAVHGSMGLFAMKKGNGYRLYDNSEKKIISKYAYDSIYGCYAYSGSANKVVVVYSAGRFGLIDAVSGKEILRPADSPITDFKNDIYTPTPLVWNIGGKSETLTSMPIYIDAPWGYKDNLNPVIHYYTWSLETYQLGTPRYGFYNKDGKEVIPPLFDQASSFINNIAIVVQGGKYGAINTNAEQVIPLIYDMIEYPYYGSLLKVIKKLDDYNSLNGIADTKGKLIVPCRYSQIEPFYHRTPDNANTVEMLQVKIKENDQTMLCGLIDTNGNEIFPIKYAGIHDDEYGRYILYDSHKRAGIADNDRNIIIPMIYNNIYTSTDPNYIIVIKGKKCGMVTPNNEILISPNKFEDIDLALLPGKVFFFAMINEKWGRIDRNGKILLPLKYEQIELYREQDDESFIVLLNEQWMHIDSWGNIIERYEKYPYEEPEMIIPPRDF